MQNTLDKTEMQMIQMNEMGMKAETQSMEESILLMSTETIEAPIEAPMSLLNEEGDHEEQSFATE